MAMPQLSMFSAGVNRSVPFAGRTDPEIAQRAPWESGQDSALVIIFK
jgi:hypothetical protein